MLLLKSMCQFCWLASMRFLCTFLAVCSLANGWNWECKKLFKIKWHWHLLGQESNTLLWHACAVRPCLGLQTIENWNEDDIWVIDCQICAIVQNLVTGTNRHSQTMGCQAWCAAKSPMQTSGWRAKRQTKTAIFWPSQTTQTAAQLKNCTSSFPTETRLA